MLWTRQFSQNKTQIGYGVATDGLGNAYVSGFTGIAQFIDGVYDPILNKYDSEGNLVWSRQLGNSHFAVSRAVSVDNNGLVYVTGETRHDLGDGPIVGDNDMFVAQYDQAGNLLWVRQVGTVGAGVSAEDVATDHLGKVYVAGHTSGNLDGSNAGIVDSFLSIFDSTGNLRQISQFGTSSNDQTLAVSTDQLGNAYVAGYTTGGLFGQTHSGTSDIFVAKFNAVPEPSGVVIVACAFFICLTAVPRHHS